MHLANTWHPVHGILYRDRQRREAKMDLVRLDSDIPVGLDPGQNPSGLVSGQLKLTILDQDLFDETFAGTYQLTENISIDVSLVVKGQDLSADALKVSFQFQGLTEASTRS